MEAGKIYTRQIKLEQVTLEEFERMENFWKKRRRKNSLGILSRVYRPIIAGSYEDLLHCLREHPYASKLGVNLHGTWMKISANKITDSQIRKLSKIAREDPLKKNYLEVTFRKPQDDHKSIIGFVEWQRNIIGYEIAVVAEHRDMFDIYSETPAYRYNNGLWVPDGWQGKRSTQEFPAEVFSSRVSF